MMKLPNSIVHDIIPFIDKSYRTQADREHRAIAGVSMGGAQTLLTALNNLDQFSYVGIFSGGLTAWGVRIKIPPPNDAATRRGPEVGSSIDSEKFKAVFPMLNSDLNTRLHLLYLTIGTDDGLLETLHVAKQVLDEKGVKYTWVELPGYGHEGSFWRLNLQDFSSKIFKSTK